jgi:exosortase/archaeosortase family protein
MSERVAPIANRAAVVVVLAAIVGAFHYSLATLVAGATLRTPVAAVAFVPLLAVGVAATRARSSSTEPGIHDRELDWLVGVPLVAVAVALSLLGPSHWMMLYWTWRLDLLALPLFAAGAISLVFGFRVLWRLKLAVALLFLAWPLPLQIVLERVVDNLTAATVSVATPLIDALLRSADTSASPLLRINTASGSFFLNITSACSGAYGLIFFTLLGGTAAIASRGRWWAKLSWFSIGLALTWLLNVARVLVIIAVAQEWGRDVALLRVHPLLGQVMFSFGVLVMLLVLPLFRLELARPRRGPPAAVTRKWRGRALALVVVVVTAAALAAGNARLNEWKRLSGAFGDPKLLSFEGTGTPALPQGWTLREVDALAFAGGGGSTPVAARYFGTEATWLRYRYVPGDATTLGGGFVVDVVTTPEWGGLRRFGVEDVYGFLKYDVTRSFEVDLAAGVVGTVSVHERGSDGVERVTLHWTIPVRTAAGPRYERVTVAADANGALEPIEEQISGIESFASTLLASQMSAGVDT